MNITYHLVPKKYFDQLDANADYEPKAFAREGFIHCTDGEYMLSFKAFSLFKDLDDELLVLFIDKDLVKAKVQFDDADKLFPHIYGTLNRNAIVKVLSMPRDRKGDWIFPLNEML